MEACACPATSMTDLCFSQAGDTARKKPSIDIERTPFTVKKVKFSIAHAMSNNNASDDRALLARLNALKKSTIDLDARKLQYESTIPTSLPMDSAPARALHSDLLDRFKSLTGQSKITNSGSQHGLGTNTMELLADEDGKTIEDLLTELGPSDSWNVPKDEDTEIKGLLISAAAALEKSQQLEHGQDQSDTEPNDANSRLTAGEPDEATISRTEALADEPELSEAELEREADEYLAQVLEELKDEPRKFSSDKTRDEPEESQSVDKTTSRTDSTDTFSLPSAPNKEPDLPPSYTEATIDDDLASRFANLGLPSVPTTINSTSSKATVKQPQKGYTDDDIDSWCIICNDDATLRCMGCDGDLYCTNCWLEGHKSKDAGYEERTHKAVQYNKGGGMKKQPAQRTMMGA